jgi:hypothetical protein
MPAKPRSSLPPLPSGTVTFLFTDVEGSTVATQTLTSARTTRCAVVSRRTARVQDGRRRLCAAFSPRRVRSRRHSRSAPRGAWPEQAAIQARMALHTGARRRATTTARRSTRWRACWPSVKARANALSEITHDLCRDRLPAGTTLKSLGEHGLATLARETVFQLAIRPAAGVSLKHAARAFTTRTCCRRGAPFTSEPEKDQEYFTDGLAGVVERALEDRRSRYLAHRHPPGKDVDIPTIAQKLNAGPSWKAACARRQTRAHHRS